MTAIKPLQNSKGITSSCLNNHKITKSTSSTRRHCVSRMKLKTSGNIKLNPGPEQNLKSETILSGGSTMLLNLRLCQLGLRPVDVGDGGDCFFQAVSHQLYCDPSHHLHCTLDKLTCNTLAITLNVLSKAILRIHGMNV